MIAVVKLNARGQAGVRIPARKGVPGPGRIRRSRGQTVISNDLARHRRPAIAVEAHGVVVDRPLRVQREVRGDRGREAECADQTGVRIPARKGVSGPGRSRRSRGQAVISNDLVPHRRPAIAVEAHGVVVDRPLRVQREVRGDRGREAECACSGRSPNTSPQRRVRSGSDPAEPWPCRYKPRPGFPPPSRHCCRSSRCSC